MQHLTKEFSQKLDREDSLRNFRDRFVIHNPELIYVDGNSLGRLPKSAVARLDTSIRSEWGERIVEGWQDGWYDLNARLGAKIASIIGAKPSEVIVCDSTSVNLFKLLVAGLGFNRDRNCIVTDEFNFPSDIYIMEGALRARAVEATPKIVRTKDGLTIDPLEIQAALSPQTAILSLTLTAFKSGYTYNLKQITEMAHKSGALMLWDLSHSAGAIEVDLNGAHVDFAVGCTYKYLNGGPGAPAYLYVREDLIAKLQNPISGWFGQQDPFKFGLKYEPARGIQRFLSGTPPIISMTGIEGGVDLLCEAGMAELRKKSVRQSEYFIELYDALLKPLGISLASPRESSMRGSHVSIAHPEAYRITKALIKDQNVLPDFRDPDVIRIGITPLYTTFEELFETAKRIEKVMKEKLYEGIAFGRTVVT